MRFKIQTLVDVSQTFAKKGVDDQKSIKQQANFNTLYNVIGLRSNPTEFEVGVNKVSIAGLGFGENYKGKQNVWTVEFTIEQEDSLTLDMLESDFDLIPFIAKLDETAEHPKALFTTLSNNCYRNIIFEKLL